jgi:hypothetical protein
MLAMKVALSDDRGPLEQAAGRDVEGEPDELGVRPGQRGVSPTKVRKVPQDSCQLPGRKGFSAIPELDLV